MRKIFAWRDQIQILNFDSLGRIVVVNTGDGEVFLSHIHLESKLTTPKPRFTTTVELHTSVKSGQLISKKIGRVEESVVKGGTEEEWARIMNSAFQKSNCLMVRVLRQESERYLQIKEFYGEKLRTFPVNASLYFYTTKDHSLIEQQFPAIGIVMKTESEECRAN